MKPRVPTFALFATCLLACTSTDAGLGRDDFAQTSDAPIYPVDPRVHVRDASLDPLDPSSIEATTPNAVAYAREVARLVARAAPSSDDVADIAAVLEHAATASGVSFEQARALATTTASSEAQAGYAAQIRAEARGMDPDAPLPRLAAEIVDARARVDACVVDGHDERACCEALAWVDVVAGSEALAPGGSYATATAERLGADAQPLSLLGAKTWLSACGPVLDDAPADLDALRARFGPYDGPEYVSELHPASLAKQGGRRVFRAADGDDALLVAESLEADCSVRETEAIVRRDDGSLAFWTFDAHGRRVPHGYFPAKKGQDAIKFAPDACMGCHYTFDTREFVVAAPSFAALQLVRVTADGVPQWEDASHCRADGEPLVEHDAPTVAR